MSDRKRTRSIATTDSDEQKIARIHLHLLKTTGASDISAAIRYALTVAAKGLPK
jgi:hypothetical protein